MKKIITLFLSLTALLLSGCFDSLTRPSADPTKFYTLNAPSVQNEVVSVGGGQEGTLRIGIRDVKIPVYLDTTRMLFRNQTNGIYYSEFLRWGEPLKESFGRNLMVALQMQPNVQYALRAPWPMGIKFNCEWSIEVLRFECIGNREEGLVAAVLEAEALAFNGVDRNPVKTIYFKLREDVKTRKMEDILPVQEKLIVELAEKIAEESEKM